MKNLKKIMLMVFLFHNLLFASLGTNQLKSECEKGNAKACMDLATYYRSGSMYYHIEKNEIKAKQYYNKYYQLANSSNNIEDLTKQCDYGLADVCRYLAYCYRDGKEVKKNRDKEIEYYKKACKLGNLLMCKKIPISDNMPEYFSTTLRLTDKNQKDIILKKLCNSGYAKACNYLFQEYKAKGKEREASTYFIKTKNLMEKNCNKNIAESCQWMWNFYLYTKKRDEGKKYFDKAKKLYKEECDSLHTSCLSYQLLLKDGY